MLIEIAGDSITKRLVPIRLEIVECAVLQALARWQGCSANTIMRKALRDYLDHQITDINQVPEEMLVPLMRYFDMDLIEAAKIRTTRVPFCGDPNCTLKCREPRECLPH